LWGLMCYSAVRSIHRHALLRAGRAVAGARIHDARRATLRLRDGLTVTTGILGTTYVTPGLTVLNLRDTGRRRLHHVLLVADNIDPEEHRALRVLLAWGRAAEGGGALTSSADSAP